MTLHTPTQSTHPPRYFAVTAAGGAPLYSESRESQHDMSLCGHTSFADGAVGGTAILLI